MFSPIVFLIHWCACHKGRVVHKQAAKSMHVHVTLWMNLHFMSIEKQSSWLELMTRNQIGMLVRARLTSKVGRGDQK